MEICKQQQIHNFCHPNALMTLKEYLTDYATDETKRVGNLLIEKELETFDNDQIKATLVDNLKKIENGGRDFNF